jgi:hypothetical protein
MINMPIRMPKIAMWPTPPSYESGKSSSKLIKIMIPATRAREMDRHVYGEHLNHFVMAKI